MAGSPPFIHGAAIAAAASVGGGGVPPPSPHLTPPFHHIIPHSSAFSGQNPEALLHYTFPSEADTLAYVDALKHSDLSDWRSLQEVAARAGAGSCSGAVTTSVLTALYLLGLFNLCAASPASCCVPPASGRRRRRKRSVDATLPPLLNNLQHNLSSLSLEQFRDLPHVTTPDGGRIPLHISVVDQVRKLWDSNPRLLSSVSCSSATESVRSSFISLSGVASGIILAYSVAQLTQCYPDHTPDKHIPPKIWFFPIPNTVTPEPFPVPTIPTDIPVTGADDKDDGCERNEVPMGYDKCAPLLSAEFCPYKHWVLLNKETGMGECVPRLCAENFVFVERDEMCHDINEPGICPGNRRLYLTASGNAICDCPEGMFPGPQDTCYYLHEPAFCYKGSVLQFDKPSKTLVCKPDPCGHINANLWPDDLPYAPRDDGYCYQFNEQGPCKKGQRFGFDSDKLEATCVSLVEAGLVRPRRSYMYQQMSYPATQDHQFPHYQVSYIIMNGSTWDLEVKGIGRNRRDIHSSFAHSHFLHAREMAVPFIDTREIPRGFRPFLKPRIPRWVTNKRNRRGSSHGKGRSNGSKVHVDTAGQAGENGKHEETVLEIQKDTVNKTGRHTSAASPTLSISASITSGDGIAEDLSQRGSHNKTTSKNARRAKLNRRNRKKKGQESSSRRNSEATLKVHQNAQESKTLHDREVVKVDQSESSAPVVVDQTAHSSRGSKGRNKKKHSRSRGSSKVRKKKKKRRNRGRGRGRGRGHGRRRGRKKPNKSKNSTRTNSERKRKNPKLPFRVPTIQPPVDANVTKITSSDVDTNTTSVDETISGSPVDASNYNASGSGESPSSVSDHNIKSDSEGAVRTKPHRVSETDSDSDVEEEEEKENPTSSSETSLPKYLRHRGRRQLGEGGGIIQAPLLSACKPGAKRDYNYKCRPKFIPQERDGKSVGGSSDAAPRPPRISCPEGTRLDPRGKCQQVS